MNGSNTLCNGVRLVASVFALTLLSASASPGTAQRVIPTVPSFADAQHILAVAAAHLVLETELTTIGHETGRPHHTPRAILSRTHGGPVLIDVSVRRYDTGADPANGLALAETVARHLSNRGVDARAVPEGFTSRTCPMGRNCVFAENVGVLMSFLYPEIRGDQVYVTVSTYSPVKTIEGRDFISNLHVVLERRSVGWLVVAVTRQVGASQQ